MLVMLRRILFCRCRRLQTRACGPTLRRCQARGHSLPTTDDPDSICEAQWRPNAR